MVKLVGWFRKWILGDLEDRFQEIQSHLEDIDSRLKALESQVLKLRDKLDEKADKERLRFIERELEQIENLNKYLFETLRDLQKYAEAEIQGSGSEPRENLISEEERIISLIKAGYDSPKNLARKAKIGVGRLYEILERLERMGKVRTIKKGRKKRIIVIED